LAYSDFVDVQVNGYLGVDFSSPKLTTEDVHRVSEVLAAEGTAYCATIITSPPELYRKNLPVLARAIEEDGSHGRLLGIHVEGPFISPVDGARGAHSLAHCRRPDPFEFDRMQEWADGNIVLLTMAPELDGGIAMIEHVRKRYRTTVSLGHHLAPQPVLREAVLAGASASTHLGNGCPNTIPRHDNVLIHQLAEPRLKAGLITDGHHLPEDFIRVAFRCKGAEGIFIVSDAAPVAGLPPGVYETLGNRVRLTETGRVESTDRPHFVGSGLNMRACVNHLRSLGLLTEDQIRLVTHDNPLRLVGMEP